jgi:hypothetical protein
MRWSVPARELEIFPQDYSLRNLVLSRTYAALSFELLLHVLGLISLPSKVPEPCIEHASSHRLGRRADSHATVFDLRVLPMPP